MPAGSPPREPRYRQHTSTLLASARDLVGVLETGSAGDISRAAALLASCQTLQAAAAAAEGIVLAELERADQGRPGTWADPGQRHRDRVLEDLADVKNAAERGEQVALTPVEAAALWGDSEADHRELPTARIPPTVTWIPTNRDPTGEIHITQRPHWWPPAQ